eukprot:TRINITY_DN9407_c0_g1_i2.p1 TRINITY_DN9407_c0_g1~~TRINITY_DN9407_c0_g1_i2.p1  ORF type:complete len:269 (-),score=47.57 TRINITY_DN9407_c0_g1_i2:10-816(-)
MCIRDSPQTYLKGFTQELLPETTSMDFLNVFSTKILDKEQNEDCLELIAKRREDVLSQIERQQSLRAKRSLPSSTTSNILEGGSAVHHTHTAPSSQVNNLKSQHQGEKRVCGNTHQRINESTMFTFTRRKTSTVTQALQSKPEHLSTSFEGRAISISDIAGNNEMNRSLESSDILMKLNNGFINESSNRIGVDDDSNLRAPASIISADSFHFDPERFPRLNQLGSRGTSQSRGSEISFSLLNGNNNICLLYTSPSPRDGLLSRMPSSA